MAIGYEPGQSASVNEDLLRQQEYAQALEAQQNEERLARQQQEREESEPSYASQAGRMARKMAVDQAKAMAKDKAKKALAKVASRGIMRAVLIYGLPVILAVLAILGGIMLILMILVYSCNQDNKAGLLTRLTSSTASFFGLTSIDYCKTFAMSAVPVSETPSRSGGAGGGASFEELDLVLTSAYRPGAVVDGNVNRPSAHGRGEAFDIALRNPIVPLKPSPSDPRIGEIISIARSVGFTHPRADIVDEYNYPSAGTQGGHVHIEFNAGYCGTPATNPPTDLVSLNGRGIPMSGVSDPRVRECMLDPLLEFFRAAGVIE